MKFILGEKRGACRLGRECKYTIYRTRGKQNWTRGINAKELSSKNQPWPSETLRPVLPDCLSILENLLYPNKEAKFDIEICAA